MLSLFDGVRAVNTRANFAEDAARRAVELAEQAAERGTFGVGGLLLNRSGEIFAEAVNAVARDGKVVDPTAHVERQLVDWLFSEPGRFGSAALNDMVILSSLDPCAMCAGAILRAGISVISLAADAISGVHGTSLEPVAMPPGLRSQAVRHMALFGITTVRPSAGADLGAFFAEWLPPELSRRADLAFLRSVDTVRQIVGSESSPALPVRSVPNLSYRSIVEKYLGTSAGVFRFAADAGHDNLVADWPDTLASVLEDHTGRVILGMQDEPENVPTSSAVVRLIRAYSWLRNAVPPVARSVLPHPRWCSIVVRRFPDDDGQALFELGAIGSFMEEARPPQARPALLYMTSGDDRRPAEILQNLPPLYAHTIGLTVARADRIA